MTEKKPPKIVWSAVCASFEEVLMALENTEALAFPIVAIPWGAETYNTDCRVFFSSDEVSKEHIQNLLLDSFPLNGKHQLHLISVAAALITPAWGKYIKGPIFKLANH